MSARQLYLVRHAEAAESDDDNPPLSQLGRLQARALGARLSRTGVAVVLHSPRRRAEQTAAIIADALPDARVHALDHLDDRTPVPSRRRRSEYPQRMWDWLAATPVSEQDIDGRRIDEAVVELAELVRAPGTGPVVAVTHAFVIGWIVRAALEAPTATWLGLAPANAGLTVLDCSQESISLTAYNDVGHLLAL